MALLCNFDPQQHSAQLTNSISPHSKGRRPEPLFLSLPHKLCTVMRCYAHKSLSIKRLPKCISLLAFIAFNGDN